MLVKSEVGEAFGVEFVFVVTFFIEVLAEVFDGSLFCGFGIDVGFEALHIDMLFRGFAHGQGAYGVFERLAGYDFFELEEEGAVGQVVEDKHQLLALVVDVIAEDTFVHQVGVFVTICAHVFQRDFFLFFPAVIAQEERAHLRAVVLHGIADGVPEVEEGVVGVYLDFSLEVVYFVRN